MNIFLDHEVLSSCYFIQISYHINSFPLTLRFWFDNESSDSWPIFIRILTFLEEMFQLFHFCRNHPSFRVESVIVGSIFPHKFKIHAKLILFREVEHSREMIAPLVVLHLWKDIELDINVVPNDIRINHIISSDLESKIFAHYFCDHFVIAMLDQKYEFWGFLPLIRVSGDFVIIRISSVHWFLFFF